MKNLKSLFTALFLTAIAFTATAQLQPRWGGGPPLDDNTGRVLTYGVLSPTLVATTTDTVNIRAPYYQTIFLDSILGTTIFIEKTTTSAGNPINYVGDRLEFMGYASKIGTPIIKFRNKYNTVWKFADTVGYHINAGSYRLGFDSTITLTNGKYFDIEFINNGTYWLEQRKTTGR